MSANPTATFGMEHGAANEDLKLTFDEEFETVKQDLKAAIPSWGCSGCCLSYKCC